ncbi:MAG TPA: hypothetical protein VNM87_00590, partial [Candidatus Udaeobacter sp.]|nr:hypothetical protein [Candidatus Udaeobacter sp.]
EDPLKGSNPNQKVVRELNMLERAIDEELVDSRDALVDHGRNANAIYIPGQGVVIAVSFGLVGWDHGVVKLTHWSGDWDDLEYYSDLYDDDDDDHDKDKEDRLTRKEIRERIKKRQAKRYVEVKQELIEVLAENADLLDNVPAQEWVTVAARPRDMSWGDAKIASVVLRVKRADITDRSDGKLTAEAYQKKVTVEEYK